MATKRNNSRTPVLRTRVKKSLKKRVEEYVRGVNDEEVTESSVLRDAVKEFLDHRQKKAA